MVQLLWLVLALRHNLPELFGGKEEGIVVGTSQFPVLLVFTLCMYCRLSVSNDLKYDAMRYGYMVVCV